VLYIERWLSAPAQDEQGNQTPRARERPRRSHLAAVGEPVSALRLGSWMARQYPQNTFERYADDAILHCQTREERSDCAKPLSSGWQLADWSSISRRPRSFTARMMTEGESRAREVHLPGLRVPPRRAKNYRGKYFISFLPQSARRPPRTSVKQCGLETPSAERQILTDLARMFNPIIRGWCSTMDATIGQCFIRYSGPWTDGWFGGLSKYKT